MNWAVVMAGGPGTRFWPESRAKRPKPFLKLLGKRTLLEETVRRLQPLFPPRRILLVIQETLVRGAKRLLPEIPRENILGEPVGRNTAPCCVYAAAQIAARDPKAKIIFLPADQYTPQKSLYLKTLKTALTLADDRPVLLGLRPDSPNPSYGYLEVARKRKMKNGLSIFNVIRFCEKPSLARARRFLKQGNFFWNGGTFAWRIEAFQRAIQEHLPRLYPAFEKLGSMRGGATTTRSTFRRRIYRTLPSVSLDYGVMEKMKNALCLLTPFQWHDLGGWVGLAEFWTEDSAGNRVGASRPFAPPVFLKAQRNIVKLDKRLVTLLGVQDLVVVDTPDALLICDRHETERIRDVVHELERRKAIKFL